MFSRRTRPPAEAAPSGRPALMSAADMAIDTVGAILRSLGEFALDQAHMDAAGFTQVAEQWAQHVLLATPPPREHADAAASAEGRRDWVGVREFVHEYCRGASAHGRTVTADLRQVVWVFVQHLSHALAADEDTDTRVREQLARLEQLARGSATGELKREVLTTVMSVSQLVEQRRQRHATEMQTLGARVQALNCELESARRAGETDALTQLYNRKALDEFLDRTVELYRAFGGPMCLLLVDLDGFKGINDRHGHTAGDAVLRQVADAVTRVFLRKNDFVARYGGDEIAVVLRDTAPADAATLADRLLRAVAAVRVKQADQTLALTASVGVAPLAPGEDATAWLQSADRALYEAKQAGRNRVAAPPPPSAPGS